jgi:uncharacterized membrane protein YgaE (UPF0421/DUF939 family)
MAPRQRLSSILARLRQPLFVRFTNPERRERLLTVRRVVVTTAAVVVAWSFGSLFDGADALVAAILALITLRVSLHASLNEALGQLVGVAIGVGIALGTLSVAGNTSVAVGAAVAGALLSSRLLGLGEEGSVNIAVTSLIVLGPGNHGDAAGDRVWGTLIGVAVAVVFSYWMHPSSPVGRTLDRVTELQQDAAQLLRRMARQLQSGYSLDDAAVWLHEARELVARIPAVREQAHEARRYARWYPWAPREQAEVVFTRFVEAEHAAVQVRTIARSLLDVTEKGRHLPPAVLSELSAALEMSAEALTQRALLTEDDPAANLPSGTAQRFNEHLVELGEELLTLDDAGANASSGAMVAALERIADSLHGESTAVSEVPQVEAEADTASRLAEAVVAPVRTVRKVRRNNRRSR